STLSTYTHDPSSDVVANVYASSRGAMIHPDHDALNCGMTRPPACALNAPVDGEASTTTFAGLPLQSTFVKYSARRPLPSESSERAQGSKTMTIADAAIVSTAIRRRSISGDGTASSISPQSQAASAAAHCSI